jgi:hypothetical protein
MPSVSRRSDGPDHVVNKRFKLCLAQRKMSGLWPGARVPINTGHKLKSQILGFCGLCVSSILG